MTLRPCIVCGEPCTGPRCDEHRLTDTRTARTHVAWRNDARWKTLSKRLRRMSPSCEFCGSTKQLTIDHVLPVSDYPELVYAEENCRVLCRSCNGRRGNTFTHDEAQAVLERLQAAHQRTHRVKYWRYINAAQRAVQAAQTRGEEVQQLAVRPHGSRGARYSPGGERVFLLVDTLGGPQGGVAR